MTRKEKLDEMIEEKKQDFDKFRELLRNPLESSAKDLELAEETAKVALIQVKTLEEVKKKLEFV